MLPPACRVARLCGETPNMSYMSTIIRTADDVCHVILAGPSHGSWEGERNQADELRAAKLVSCTTASEALG